MDRFRGIHKDKMAFLIGAGVSFDAVDVEKLKPYITLAINEVAFKLPNPDYFFTCDGGLTEYGLLDIISKNTHLILSNEYDFTDEGIVQLLQKYNFTQISSVKRKTNDSTVESATMRKTDDKLVFGLSSAHCAAHLLYIMGCNPIVLLGCDCKFTAQLYAYWMLPKYKELLTSYYIDEQGNANLPHPGVHKETMIRNLPGHLSAIRQYWEMMHKLAPDAFFINACDGAMQGFIKMTLDEVLDRYKQRVK